jgi:hypothetical protein
LRIFHSDSPSKSRGTHGTDEWIILSDSARARHLDGCLDEFKLTRVGDLCMGAEELSILFYVCVFNDIVVCVCFCNVCSVYQDIDGHRTTHCMESFGSVTSIHRAHGVHLYLCLVCWWTDSLPSVSCWHKSGPTFFSLFTIASLYSGHLWKLTLW